LTNYSQEEDIIISRNIREAIFSSIVSYISNADVLDLFGGTGAMSLEAISRGANSAVIIDNSRAAVDVITENVNKLKLSDVTIIIKSDANKWLDTADNKVYDLIIVDPPYHQGLYDDILNKIDSKKLLSNVGVLVVEHPKDITFGNFNNLKLLKERYYGQIVVTYYVSC